jgi:hypothetical protein
MTIHVNRRRVGGSGAALVVLYGVPAVVFFVADAGPYALAAAIAVVAAAWLAARLLWPERLGAVGLAYVGGAGLVAAGVAVVGFIAVYAAIISAGLCGSDGTSTPVAGGIALVIVYGIVGLWAFQRPQRLLWAWAVAIALAFAVDFVVTAAIPSAHGYCET